MVQYPVLFEDFDWVESSGSALERHHRSILLEPARPGHRLHLRTIEHLQQMTSSPLVIDRPSDHEYLGPPIGTGPVVDEP